MNDAADTVAPSPEWPTMARPIERLPSHRPNHERKEAMNCKNCRKRKIKCTRLKPQCEACKVFKVDCIYDAVPKKRGPKTDVMEALLRRVNNLEKRWGNDAKKTTRPVNAEAEQEPAVAAKTSDDSNESIQSSPTIPMTTNRTLDDVEPPAQWTGIEPPDLPYVSIDSSAMCNVLTANRRASDPTPSPALILDTYFHRLHERPYYILDEAAIRSRYATGRLPRFLANALFAATVRFARRTTGEASGGLMADSDIQMCNAYAEQARTEIDDDEPSIDHIQAYLLLALAYLQTGRGKKAYMSISHAVTMAYALELHRELPMHLNVPQVEREGRRKLFWTCYLMERLTITGSKKPPLIADETITLRLPANRVTGQSDWADGDFFPNASTMFSGSGAFYAFQGAGATLVEITRILGVANKYLLLGGVRGDSHFPWHTQSALSKIIADLDAWAAGTQETFSSLDTLFGQADSPTYLLSKLIYHTIHCLVYRPFLPVTLTDISGSSTHQSWQIEKMKLVFAHADAIVQLVECAKSAGFNEWPHFVGYCVSIAATVHLHGAHYGHEGHLFGQSSGLLAREMAQLQDLRTMWACVDHQRDTLQSLHAAHGQLMQALANGSIMLPSVFQMENFLDRYPGLNIEEVCNPLRDINAFVSQQTQSSGSSSYPATNMNDHRPSTSFSSNHTLRLHPSRTTDTSVPSYPTPTSASVADPNEIEFSNANSLHRTITSQSTQTAPPQFQLYKGPDSPPGLLNNNDHNHHLFHQQTLPHHNPSPGYALSPVPHHRGSHSGGSTGVQGFSADDPRHDSFLDASAVENSSQGDDPFLNLLEQLASNESGFNHGASGSGRFDAAEFEVPYRGGCGPPT